MLRKILIAATMILSSTAVFAADLKIGVVDMQLVETSAPQVKTINEKIQKQFKDKQDALIALQKKGRDLQEKAKKEEMTLTFAQKMDYSRQLQEIDAEFNMKKKFLDEDISIAQKQEIQKIRIKIMQAIQKVAADEKYDLIIRSDAALHAVTAINVTPKIIAIVSNPAG